MADASSTSATPLQQTAETATAEGASSADLPPEPISLDRILSILGEKLVTWFDAAVALLPNILIALILLVVAFAVGSIVGKACTKAFRKAFDSVAVANLCAALVKISVIALGLFVALDLLGLQKAVVSLLAGAGIIGLAIGFAFQDLAENLLAGLLMGVRKPFQPGDLIHSNGQFGWVDDLNLRNTIVRNFSGQIIYIPNKEVFKNVLMNFSKSGERRIELAVGVSYGEDLKQVAEVVSNAIQSIEGLKEDRDVEVFAMEFGDSSINFTVRYWVDYPGGKIGYFAAIDAGVKAIKEAFDANDILIPFPIRTLDFDAKGGLKLGETLKPILGQPGER